MAEIEIKTLKDGCKRHIFDTKFPMVFLCYCIERRTSVINSTIRVNNLLEGQPSYSRLTGQPTDISSKCGFGWHNWVIYRVEGHKYPLQHQRPGRALGTPNNSVSVMSQWVLTGTGYIMSIQTLMQVKPTQRRTPVMIKRMNYFDKHTKNNYGKE